MAGTMGGRLGVAVVFVLTGAAGRVLGAGEGGTEELTTVFGRMVAAGAVEVAAGAVEVVVGAVEVVAVEVVAVQMGLAVLPGEVASFACPSFAS